MVSKIFEKFGVKHLHVVLLVVNVVKENVTLHLYRWRLWEKLTVIDRDLKHHFSVYVQYDILFR